MMFRIEHNGITHNIELDYQTQPSCCGIRVWKDLELSDISLIDLHPATRKCIARKLGEVVIEYTRRSGYGQILVSTVAEGKFNEHDDEDMGYEPYEPNRFDDHIEKFNLGTMMRALGATAGLETFNPNSGNHVVTYALDVNKAPLNKAANRAASQLSWY